MSRAQKTKGKTGTPCLPAPEPRIGRLTRTPVNSLIFEVAGVEVASDSDRGPTMMVVSMVDGGDSEFLSDWAKDDGPPALLGLALALETCKNSPVSRQRSVGVAAQCVCRPDSPIGALPRGSSKLHHERSFPKLPPKSSLRPQRKHPQTTNRGTGALASATTPFSNRPDGRESVTVLGGPTWASSLVSLVFG